MGSRCWAAERCWGLLPSHTNVRFQLPHRSLNVPPPRTGSPSGLRLPHFIMNAANGSRQTPEVSERVKSTDAPCIVKTKQLMAGVEGVLSLAQGVVFWKLPDDTLKQAAALTTQTEVQGYGPCEGLPQLREALKKKLKEENGLDGCDVMVTTGANQAFVNVLLTLVDSKDKVLLFTPYYFNHLMAVQMTGGGERVVYGVCHPDTWHPDLDWLERTVNGPDPPKLVVIINPCNPTGVLLSREELDRANQICRDAGVWLCMDNTYEHFVYDGRTHHCINGPNVINIFSFSKAYGMMGWRIGYIAYPAPQDEADPLAAQIVKIQDTIPICAAQLNQYVALEAVNLGRQWVESCVQQIEENRLAMMDALSPLGTLGNGIAGGEGAIYFWAKLPKGMEDDEAVVEWLVRNHRVCLIPGSSCGCPGYVRAAFANLQPEQCQEACRRLKEGLTQLVEKGMVANVAAK